jgi:uncharacterized RDD family membrane protein YckC
LAFPEATGPAAGRTPAVPGQPGERLPGGAATAARQGGPEQSSPGFGPDGGAPPAQGSSSPAAGGVAGAGVPWQRQVHEMAQPQVRPQAQVPPQGQLPPQGQPPQGQVPPQGQLPPHGQSPHAQVPPQGLAPQAEEQPLPWKPVSQDPFASSLSQARPAGLGQRLGARLIDGLIVGAVVAVAAVPLGSAAYEHVQRKIDAARLTGEKVTVWLIDGTTGVQLGIIAAVLIVAGVLYEVVPTGKWGQTLGKKLFKLKVLDIESQYEPGFGASLRRWLAQTVLNVLLIGAVGAAWCLFDRPWRQGWHDKLARTFVAKDA